MKGEFKYIQTGNLNDATSALKQGAAVVYAGGTDILGLIKNEITHPKNLVNIKFIKELQGIKEDREKGLVISALTSISELAESKIVRQHWPLLAEAAKQVASPQLRNMATVAGNLCQRPRCWYFRGNEYHCIRKGGDTCFAYEGRNKYHCIVGGDTCFIVHPSDLAVALQALGASVEIYNNGKFRNVSLDQFFVLPEIDDRRENILQAGDIITHIIVPRPSPATRFYYYKHRERGSWDFAIVSIAAVLETRGKTVKKGRVVFGGVAPIPWEDETVRKNLPELIVNNKNVDALVKNAFQNADPLAENGYKVVLAKNLLKKALKTLMG